MALRGWLMFLHTCGVILYVGGDVLLNTVAFRAYKRRDASGLLQSVEAATPAIGTGAVLTLLSGAGLVLESSAWQFTTPWVLAGIAMVVIAGSAESIYFGRQLTAIRAILDTKGREAPEIAEVLWKVVCAAAAINVMFVVVVWLMVFKPTL